MYDDDTNLDEKLSSTLSYKFQRLRERIRQAILAGEFSGKLPGERQLAARFRVNAKTLSKALTDLAAEGLLERCVGRGTFLKGHNTSPTGPAETDRWLLVCDAGQRDFEIIRMMQRESPSCTITTDPTSLRRSALSQFKGVVDFSSQTPEAFVRDLMVRNVNVVQVGKRAKLLSTHTVVIDEQLGASLLARDFMLAGHLRIAVVESAGSKEVVQAVRSAAGRYASGATIDACSPENVASAVENGATAIICGGRILAARVREQLDRLGIDLPGRVSMGAIGAGSSGFPCSGYYVRNEQKIETILHLMRERAHQRPATIWLTGTFHDAGTIAPLAAEPEVHALQSAAATAVL